MKSEPSEAMREVWVVKVAAHQETARMRTAHDCFRHIHERLPDLGLPRVRVQPRRTVIQT